MTGYKVGDHVVGVDKSNPEAPKSFTGVIERVVGQFIYLRRDDGVEGGSADGAWLTFESWIYLDHSVETVPDVVVPKGYTPDGFDVEAHRSFMKTLGSAS